MTSERAAGQRFLAVAGEPMSMLEIARLMRRELGDLGSKSPRRQLPDAVVKVMALTSPRMRELVTQIGKRRRSSNAKAREWLGWSPRPNARVILDTARSLIDRRLVTA